MSVFNGDVFPRRWVKNIATMIKGFYNGACMITSPHFTISRVHSAEQSFDGSSAGRLVDDMFFYCISDRDKIRQ